MKELTSIEPTEFSLDGKAIRSTNNHGDPEKALQIVTAYDVNNRIPLAQKEIEDKTNEITAGRELLKLFDLTNTIRQTKSSTQILQKSCFLLQFFDCNSIY